MKKQGISIWSAANAVGLGLSFVAMLQVSMLLEFGLVFDKHWQFIAPGQDFWAYAGRFVSALVGGLVFGSAQLLVLRSRLPRILPWLLTTTVGFGLITPLIEWPLMAANIWGRIPGPLEPIIVTVGSCSLAGLLQYLTLRGRGIVASKWLALWLVGLVVSLVPTAALFMSLEGMGLALSWPIEVFLSGFAVAGVAALISGGALFSAVAGNSSSEARSMAYSPS